MATFCECSADLESGKGIFYAPHNLTVRLEDNIFYGYIGTVRFGWRPTSEQLLTDAWEVVD